MREPEAPKVTTKRLVVGKRKRYADRHHELKDYKRLKHPRMLRRLAKTNLLHTLFRQDHIPVKDLALARQDLLRDARRGLLFRLSKVNPWTLKLPTKAEAEHARICEITTRPED